MSLETGTYIGDLVATNPTSSDPKSQGDDHLRLIKTVLQNTFAGFSGMVFVRGTEAAGSTANDYVVTLSTTPAAMTTGMIVLFIATHTNTGTSTTLKINSLTAVTLYDHAGNAPLVGCIKNGAACAAYYDGTNAYLISGNGLQYGVTATVGDSSTKLATTAFVAATAFASSLPAQTGNSGKVTTTDGANASWAYASSLLANNYQEFTGSGTWTKPANCAWVYVEAIGGGGGGFSGTTGGGSGGGGGGFNAMTVLASTLTSTVTVTVGAGGNAGIAGGDTTFGAYLTARGGAAGTATSAVASGDYATANSWSSGGGGAGTGSGSAGQGGSCIKAGAGGGGGGPVAAGSGGTSSMGGAGGAGATSGTATAGTAPGGGGGGSYNGTGGAGAAGRVRVWAW